MKINLLPFDVVEDTIDIEVFEERKSAAHTAHITFHDCPKIWSGYGLTDEGKWLFYPLDEQAKCCGNKYKTRLSLKTAPDFAVHYIKQLLINHFRTISDVAVECDFVGNVVVWVPATTPATDSRLRQMQRFAVKPCFKTYSDGFELRISYAGTSSVITTPISDRTPATQHCRILSDGRIHSIKTLSQQEKQHINQIYPILNKELEKEYNINRPYTPKPKNRYQTNIDFIKGFIGDYIFTPEMEQILHFTSTDFLDVPEEHILRASADCSRILFGNSNYFPDISQMDNYCNGLKTYGPYMPSPKNDVRFLFILQQGHEDTVKKLYKILKSGLGNSFPSLSQFIRQQFTLNENKKIDVISFSSCATAIEEIRSQLIENRLNTTDITYIAIYLSPIQKTAPEYHELYYKIKELLLQKNITSQVIWNQSVNNSSFNYYLPNIASAILAKIGGAPWALQPTGKSGDLIIGVGAFKHYDIGERYIGSAFCFDENGVFESLDCHKSDDISKLAADIGKAIGHFVVEHGYNNLNRLVIHYYKEMSDKDARPITNMLYKLGFKIPVYVVTINKTESSDYIAFKPDSTDLMPLSGTFVQIKPFQYLVYNNAKYSEAYSQSRGWKDYLFPIRIRIARIDKNLDGIRNEIKPEDAPSILEQVYQFSRMYWKSVKQQNLPITVAYPEMVAQIVPYFNDRELPAFGKTNMWFL